MMQILAALNITELVLITGFQYIIAIQTTIGIKTHSNQTI
jgi:hypothetical protein